MDKPIKKKTPTEKASILDFFQDFKIEYMPFVSWVYKNDNTKFLLVYKFHGDKPERYTNKWNRDQWKMEITDEYDQSALLSGGKRLFQTLLLFCQKTGKLPSELPPTIIWRKGSGFDTKYKMELKFTDEDLL